MHNEIHDWGVHIPLGASPNRRRLSGLSFTHRRLEISSRVASHGAAREASQSLEKSCRIWASLAAAAAITGGGGGPRPRALSAAVGFFGHTLTAVLRMEQGRSGACTA